MERQLSVKDVKKWKPSVSWGKPGTDPNSMGVGSLLLKMRIPVLGKEMCLHPKRQGGKRGSLAKTISRCEF